MNAGSKGVEPTDEALYKYGWQDKDDPSVINWTARINYKKSYMENVNISDTWSDDQDYVENSLNFYYVSSVDPFVYEAPATDALANAKVRANGFDTTIAKIDKKILYVEYKTKLKQLEYNPTNKIDVSWDGGGTGFDAETKLVGGSGHADGKTRPKFELPNEAPIVDKPEWKGGTTPFDAPVLDKPEAPIPNDPKPEEPIKPVTPKPEQPKSEDPKPQEPKSVTPVKPVAPKSEKPAPQKEAPKAEPAPKFVDSTTKILPNTGSVERGIYIVIGLAVAVFGFILKHKEKEGE